MNSFDVFIDDVFVTTIYARKRTQAWAELGKSGLYERYDINTLSARVARVKIFFVV